MVAARGAEESTAWRQPVDLVALCEESTSELADLFAARRGSRDWSGHAALAQELLGDDPASIVDALKEAIRAGAAPADLGQSLAYAAALRVARFGNANEYADWETAHHAFTYANAVHQMLTRIGTANIDTHVAAVRGVLHGAMALYLARYLNVPPARIPGEQLDDLPADPETMFRSRRSFFIDAIFENYSGDVGDQFRLLRSYGHSLHCPHHRSVHRLLSSTSRTAPVAVKDCAGDLLHNPILTMLSTSPNFPDPRPRCARSTCCDFGSGNPADRANARLVFER
jgi:hypothetical protein